MSESFDLRDVRSPLSHYGQKKKLAGEIISADMKIKFHLLRHITTRYLAHAQARI